MEEDMFDEILNLETTYYTDGYKVGQEEGKAAGMVEGRIFGMERGFEKFLQMGKLHGRAIVWEQRTEANAQNGFTRTEQGPLEQSKERAEGAFRHSGEKTGLEGLDMARLPESSRLSKHLRTLVVLTSPEDIPTANDEDSVDSFEDRFKRATSRAVIVSKIVNEDSGVATSQTIEVSRSSQLDSRHPDDLNIEDTSVLHFRS